jgi:predicted RNase H-like nuclease
MQGRQGVARVHRLPLPYLHSMATDINRCGHAFPRRPWTACRLWQTGTMNGAEAAQRTSLFLGVDLGWSTGATGLAVVDDRGRLTASARLRSDDEIAEWIAAQPGRVVVAAVDAPLIVPNETGQRVPERLIGQAFGGFGASAHTANRTRFPGGDTRAKRLAQHFGWSVDPRTPTGGDVDVCIEVYPHPAMVGLFELPYRLDYKKGNDQRRAPGFQSLVQLIESVPELDLVHSPRWAQLKRDLSEPRPGDLNRVEDEVDAIVCAHLAWLWHHRPSTLQVYGDVDAGYIIAPPPPLHRPQQLGRRDGTVDVRRTFSQGIVAVESAEAGSTAVREQPLAAGCRCGCGEQVGRRALYRPGHDARHVSQVGRAMMAAGAEDPDLLAALPSEALRAKARAMLERSASHGRQQPQGTVARHSPPRGTPPVRSAASPHCRHWSSGR